MNLETFKNNDRVAFVGDSITHCGDFIYHIVNCYKQAFPENNIMFFNCGVAGASISNCGFSLMEEDVLSLNPNIAIIMYGMNDSRRDALNEADIELRNKALNEAFENYKNNLEKLVNSYLEKNIKVILCTPTPYDEFSKTNVPSLKGGLDLLNKYASFVRDFAQKRSISLIDFNLMFQELLTKNYIKEDHVHPNEKGHFEMAKYFLSLQGLSLTNRELIPSVKKWAELVSILRNVMATRFLVIGLDEKDENIKIKKCQTVKEDYEGSEYLEYFLQLSDTYLKHSDEKLLRKQVDAAMLEIISTR